MNVVIGESTNVKHLDRVAYVLRRAGPSDAVYDGDIIFNLFRKDVDYFWFSLGDRQMLGTYRSLRSYDLDICDRIDKMRPKVISTYHVPDLGDPRIRDHYVPSEQFPMLLSRTR